ncbi:TetR/AcrR family transcriptional regulator [Microbacterium indicum]|uniref:TetR/AcrR family transcriptional regulator n=1 Tax=Microbacterium indicum TaxID=358100 RepID=UPI00048E535B|nr:TetR family transcriptional regulator [Microbacterium indicum]
MARRVPNDPERREKILDAALAVIADHGSHGTTHRKIAAAADVPLGSLTYYFDGIADIIAQAFDRMHLLGSAQYRAALERAADRDEAEQAVIELICGPEYMPEREVALLFEMYAYANKNEAVAATTREWLERSHESLLLHFEPAQARALDVLIEGWPIHRVFARRALDRDLVARTVRAVIAANG